MENFERIKELTKERLLQRRRKRRLKVLWQVALCSAVVVIVCSIAAVILQKKADAVNFGGQITQEYRVEKAPDLKKSFIEESDNQKVELNNVQALILHDSLDLELATQNGTEYHFFIKDKGEIIQLKPLNGDMIVIVCESVTSEGRFTEKTYDALVELTAWLIGQCELDMNGVSRHQDYGELSCPVYFVENESAWEDFKLDVEMYIETHGVKNKTNEVISWKRF